MKIKMQVENRIPAKSTVKEKKGTIIKGPNVFSSFAKWIINWKVGKAKELLKGQVQH